MCANTTPLVPSVQETIPLFHNPVAHRARRLIAAAAHHQRSGLQPSQGRYVRRDRASDLARFVAPGQNRAIQAEPVHHLVAPAPVYDVEHTRPRGVRYFGRELAVSRNRT